MRLLLLAAVAALAAAAAPAPAPAAGNCGAAVRGVGPGRAPMTMCANVTSLGADGGAVKISWAGDTDPSNKDMVELYFVSDLPLTNRSRPPLKSFPATLAPTHLTQGRGEIVMDVGNLRWPVRALMTASRSPLPTARVATRGQSGDIAFDAPNAPQQVHSAPGKDASEAIVAWSTRDGQQPRVEWGSAPDKLTAGAASGETFAYTPADMCGLTATAAGWSQPGAMHRAVIKGLKPGDVVFYRVFDAATPSLSATGVYHAPPPPASPTRIAFKADEGQADADGASKGSGWVFAPARNTSAAVAADAARAGDAAFLTLPASARTPPPTSTGFNATLIVHGGDVSYANGVGAMWDAYMRDNEPAHARAGVVAVIGNHERDHPGPRPADGARDRFGNSSDSGGECGVPFFARFTAPGGAVASPWWALDWGAIRFVGWSSEDDFAPGSPQHTFVRRALAETNRTATPFLIAVAHRPLYVDSAYPGAGNASDSAFSADARAALEPLFLDAGVDLTLAGHHHSYQRTCPVGRDGKCVEDDGANAIVHVVAGHAGAEFTDGTMYDPTPPLFRRVSFEHGHVRLAADADALTVTSLDDATGAVIDEFTLKARRKDGGGEGRRSRSIAASSAG